MDDAAGRKDQTPQKLQLPRVHAPLGQEPCWQVGREGTNSKGEMPKGPESNCRLVCWSMGTPPCEPRGGVSDG